MVSPVSRRVGRERRRLIAGEEDRGTLDLLLSSPLSRTQVALEKLAAMCVEVVGLGLVLWLALWIGARAFSMEISARNPRRRDWSGRAGGGIRRDRVHARRCHRAEGARGRGDGRPRGGSVPRRLPSPRSCQRTRGAVPEALAVLPLRGRRPAPGASSRGTSSSSSASGGGGGGRRRPLRPMRRRLVTAPRGGVKRHADVHGPVARPVELVKKIPCHVPSASVAVVPQRHEHTQAHERRAEVYGRVLLPSSTCCQPRSSRTSRSSAISKSRATIGSACSLIVPPAVVRHVDEDGRPALAADRVPDGASDVDEVALPLCLEP